MNQNEQVKSDGYATQIPTNAVNNLLHNLSRQLRADLDEIDRIASTKPTELRLELAEEP